MFPLKFSFEPGIIAGNTHMAIRLGPLRASVEVTPLAAMAYERGRCNQTPSYLQWIQQHIRHFNEDFVNEQQNAINSVS
jgi:hypothetical protein